MKAERERLICDKHSIERFCKRDTSEFAITHGTVSSIYLRVSQDELYLTSQGTRGEAYLRGRLAGVRLGEIGLRVEQDDGSNVRYG